MDFVKISHQDGYLILENFKRKELLLVHRADGVWDLYVNLESKYLSDTERNNLSIKHSLPINPYLDFAICRLELTKYPLKQIDDWTNEIIEIPKGWEDEHKMATIYLGWSIETFENKIRLRRNSMNKFSIEWTCLTGDLNYYDSRAKLCSAEIHAELNLIEFKNKEEFWKYEKERIDRGR